MIASDFAIKMSQEGEILRKIEADVIPLLFCIDKEGPWHSPFGVLK